MPEKIAEFKNVEIINNGSIIDNQTTNQALTYGTGKILEELNYETANNKIRIQTGNKKENIRIKYIFDDENINLSYTISFLFNQSLTIFLICSPILSSLLVNHLALTYTLRGESILITVF